MLNRKIKTLWSSSPYFLRSQVYLLASLANQDENANEREKLDNKISLLKQKKNPTSFLLISPPSLYILPKPTPEMLASLFPIIHYSISPRIVMGVLNALLSQKLYVNCLCGYLLFKARCEMMVLRFVPDLLNEPMRLRGLTNYNALENDYYCAPSIILALLSPSLIQPSFIKHINDFFKNKLIPEFLKYVEGIMKDFNSDKYHVDEVSTVTDEDEEKYNPDMFARNQQKGKQLAISSRQMMDETFNKKKLTKRRKSLEFNIDLTKDNVLRTADNIRNDKSEEAGRLMQSRCQLLLSLLKIQMLLNEEQIQNGGLGSVPLLIQKLMVQISGVVNTNKNINVVHKIVERTREELKQMIDLVEKKRKEYEKRIDVIEEKREKERMVVLNEKKKEMDERKRKIQEEREKKEADRKKKEEEDIVAALTEQNKENVQEEEENFDVIEEEEIEISYDLFSEIYKKPREEDDEEGGDKKIDEKKERRKKRYARKMKEIEIKEEEFKRFDVLCLLTENSKYISEEGDKNLIMMESKEKKTWYLKKRIIDYYRGSLRLPYNSLQDRGILQFLMSQIQVNTGSTINQIINLPEFEQTIRYSELLSQTTNASPVFACESLDMLFLHTLSYEEFPNRVDVSVEEFVNEDEVVIDDVYQQIFSNGKKIHQKAFMDVNFYPSNFVPKRLISSSFEDKHANFLGGDLNAVNFASLSSYDHPVLPEVPYDIFDMRRSPKDLKECLRRFNDFL
jgi:hypothetical protein